MIEVLNKVATMSSREIAEITGKEHRHVLRDVDKLNDTYKNMGLPKVGQGYYTHPNTGDRKYREFNLTKMQTFDLMTGYNAVLRIKVNRRWEELEESQNKIDLSNPDTILRIAQNWKKEQELRIMAEETIIRQKPLVTFANALQISEHNILIGELAKIIKQNGVDIGQNRLFQWLRENGYLIKQGQQYNLPTQKSLELNLFKVKTTTINNPNGSVRVTKTTKVTPKGQEYLINKFLKDCKTE